MRAIVTGMLALALSGCGGSDPAQQLRVGHSWVAAAELTGQAWVEGRVPRRFALTSLREAGKALEEQAHKARAGASAAADLGEARTSVAALRTAIEREDRAEARRQLAALGDQRARLSDQLGRARS
jgi:hypothetical protein